MTVVAHIRFATPALLVGIVSAGAFPCSVAADKPTPDLSVGEAVYQQSCARCHGITGQGDGRDAKRLYPKPRDLTEGVYKFRSTASGTPPTDEDLFRTVTKGLPGSGMPDWSHVDEALRWQLVYYLKSLSSVFADVPPEPLSLGPSPGQARVDLDRGKQIYETLGCAACHGTHGAGDGLSAATLVDNWGRSTRSANLTQGWNYRGGSDPELIAMRVLTGIDGSPMPSYAEAASVEDIWQLAYYVHSLQQEPRWTMTPRVPYLTGSLPETIDDPRWSLAERAEIRMRNTIQREGEANGPSSVTTISVQAVYHDEAIRFRLSWYDPSEDRDEPVDALALVLAPEGLTSDATSLQVWPLRDALALDLCVWSANRPEAREALVTSYEPILQGAGLGIPVVSHAVYDTGQWTLLMTRPLRQEQLPGATQIVPGRALALAVVIWDGGNPGQRAVSMWIDAMLQPPTEPSRATGWSLKLVWLLAAVVLFVSLGVVLRRL